MPFEVTPKGIRCPECQGKDWRVLEKRDGHGYIRRRHACNADACREKNIRWTTYQRVQRGVRRISVPRGTHATRSV